jgi:hypothetical protein
LRFIPKKIALASLCWRLFVLFCCLIEEIFLKWEFSYFVLPDERRDPQLPANMAVTQTDVDVLVFSALMAKKCFPKCVVDIQSKISDLTCYGVSMLVTSLAHFIDLVFLLLISY